MSERYTFKGTLSFEEYHECHLHLVMVRRFVIRTVAVTFGLVVIGSELQRGISPAQSGGFILGAFLVLYGLVLSPVQFKWRVKRNWGKYPSARKEFEMTLSEDGVDSEDDRGSPNHTNWDNFIKFKETPSLFMVYLSPLLPLLFPKRLLQSGTVEEVRTLLETKVGKGR